MSTDERTMQVPECRSARTCSMGTDRRERTGGGEGGFRYSGDNRVHGISILSSSDNEKENSTVSNCVKFDARQLAILERFFEASPFIGKRKQQLVEEVGVTALEIETWFQKKRAILRRQAQREANRLNRNNAPQPRHASATILVRIYRPAYSVLKRKERNSPCSVRSAAQSVHPVSDANFCSAVNGHGDPGLTPGSIGTGSLLQLNTAHLGAGSSCSGADPHSLGSFRVYSQSADGTEAGVHLNQGHLVAGSSSAEADSHSPPQQLWTNDDLALEASMPCSKESSSREVEFADMFRDMAEQVAPEVATTGQTGVVQDYNLLSTHPPVSAELSYPADPATVANLNIGAVGDRGEQTPYGAALGGAQAHEQVGHCHQFAVPPSSGPDLPSLLQPWERANLLEHLDHLAQKFRHMADIHDEWTRGKEEMLQIQDFPQCRLNEIKDLKKKHEAFESDLVAHQDSVKRIAAIAQELNALGYHESASLNARCQLICDQWERLDMLTKKRRSTLEEAERVLEIDRLHLEFAKRAGNFNNWLDGAREDLVDMFIVHTMEEIQGPMDAHEQFKQILGEADKEYKAIVGLAEEAQAIATEYQVPVGVKNPYTTLSPQEITGKWSEVKQLVPKRDQVLQAELMRQQSNERLRRKFAEKANVLGPWIEQQMAALAAFGMGMQGSLEEQLQRLHEYEQAAAQYQPHLEELEGTHQEVQEAMILENRYTEYRMETLRVGWDQLMTSLHSKVNNIAQELTNELSMSFNHLEKNSTALLIPEEFMSCQGDADYRLIMNIVEPNNTSYDHSDAFLDPMTGKSTDGETDEQIINCIRTIFDDKATCKATATPQLAGLPTTHGSGAGCAGISPCVCTQS